jgi:oxaloacetate decarboxylase alpha subunit
LRDQLRATGASVKLDAVLEEISRVREALGYPVMVTPVSQLVGVQAVLNILHGPYEVIPTEVRKYVLGRYGQPEGPISEDLLDRVHASGADLPPPEEEGTIERIRRERGPFESDDDLILHLMFHREQLEQIPPYNRRRADVASRPFHHLVNALEALAAQKQTTSIEVSTEHFRFRME